MLHRTFCVLRTQLRSPRRVCFRRKSKTTKKKLEVSEAPKDYVYFLHNHTVPLHSFEEALAVLKAYSFEEDKETVTICMKCQGLDKVSWPCFRHCVLHNDLIINILKYLYKMHVNSSTSPHPHPSTSPLSPPINLPPTHQPSPHPSTFSPPINLLPTHRILTPLCMASLDKLRSPVPLPRIFSWIKVLLLLFFLLTIVCSREIFAKIACLFSFNETVNHCKSTTEEYILYKWCFISLVLSGPNEF